jgi:hypothetical protein
MPASSVTLPLVVLLAATRALAAGPADEPAEEREFTPRRVVRRTFPPITDAPHISAANVRDQVTDSELVIGVVVGSVARAYPINMLTGPTREIINDVLAGTAIAATW